MLLGQLTDKLGIGIAVRAAKLVIEMTNVRFPPKLDQCMKHGNGVRAAGHADKQRFAGREQLQERLLNVREHDFNHRDTENTEVLRPLCLNYAGFISVTPPRYGASTSGNFRLPSACW